MNKLMCKVCAILDAPWVWLEKKYGPRTTLVVMLVVHTAVMLFTGFVFGSSLT